MSGANDVVQVAEEENITTRGCFSETSSAGRFSWGPRDLASVIDRSYELELVAVSVVFDDRVFFSSPLD